jgi:hypothetical protein
MNACLCILVDSAWARQRPTPPEGNSGSAFPPAARLARPVPCGSVLSRGFEHRITCLCDMPARSCEPHCCPHPPPVAWSRRLVASARVESGTPWLPALALANRHRSTRASSRLMAKQWCIRSTPRPRISSIACSPATPRQSGSLRLAPTRSRQANYDVSPDGSHLLFLAGVDDQRLIIVYNWAAELHDRLRSPGGR